MQVLFDYQQFSSARTVAGFQGLTIGIETANAAWDAAEDFDLTLSIEDLADGLHCQFAYSAELFEEETVARMAATTLLPLAAWVLFALEGPLWPVWVLTVGSLVPLAGRVRAACRAWGVDPRSWTWRELLLG